MQQQCAGRLAHTVDTVAESRLTPAATNATRTQRRKPLKRSTHLLQDLHHTLMTHVLCGVPWCVACVVAGIHLRVRAQQRSHFLEVPLFCFVDQLWSVQQCRSATCISQPDMCMLSSRCSGLEKLGPCSFSHTPHTPDHMARCSDTASCCQPMPLQGFPGPIIYPRHHTLARSSSSRVTPSSQPSNAAACRGVLPAASTSFTSSPRSTSCRMAAGKHWINESIQLHVRKEVLAAFANCS